MQKKHDQKFMEKNGSAAKGTREKFAEGTPGKSAFRKPFAPEIEKRIIELANNNKLGAQAIADKLTEEFGINFSRSPIGKRITAFGTEAYVSQNLDGLVNSANIALKN